MSITTYSSFYKDTDWTNRSYDTGAVLKLFGPGSGTTTVTGPQLFEEIKRTTEAVSYTHLTLPTIA